MNIYRKLDGYLDYLDKSLVRWTRDKDFAAKFDSRKEAEEAREKIAGSPPAKEHGRYPHIG